MIDNKDLEKISLMLVSRGPRVVTVDDMAKAIGKSKKTIYQNFKNKEEIIFESIRIFIVNIYGSKFQEIRKLADNPFDAFVDFRNYNLEFQNIEQDRKFTEDLIKYYPSLYDQYFIMCESFFTKFYTTLIEDGKKAGLVRKDVDIKSVVDLYVRSVFKIRTSSDNCEPYSPDKLDDHLYLVFLEGIATKKGIQALQKYKTNPNNDEKS